MTRDLSCYGLTGRDSTEAINLDMTLVTVLDGELINDNLHPESISFVTCDGLMIDGTSLMEEPLWRRLHLS